MVVTGAFGGGGLTLGGSVGGGLRARFGVGARQEVGVESTVLYAGSGEHHPGDPAWVGSSAAFGLKLSWKIAPLPYFAVIAGPGFTASSVGNAVGGTAGVIFSRSTGLVRPYAAAIGGFAVPVGRALDMNGGVTGGLGVPIGLALVLRPAIRLYFEAGFLAAWADDSPVSTGLGGYGALGLSGTIPLTRQR